MTATTTKPKPKTAVLTQLEKLEHACAEAEAKASKLSRESHGKEQRALELLDQRRRLIYHEPRLVTHAGEPLEPDNEIAKIDAEIGELGDLEDLRDEAEHAKRLGGRAKQEVARHVGEHFGEIVEQYRPEAEAATADVRAKAAELAEALDVYLAAYRRSVGLTEPIQGLDGRHVPGVNEAADLQRTVTDVNLPVPVPGGERVA